MADENNKIDLLGWLCFLGIAALILVLFLLATRYPVQANPFVCDDVANTCTYRVTAVEPTKTGTGAALTNYKQTNIKTSVNGGAFTTLVKLATAPTGGGTVTQDITFASAPCVVTSVVVKVSGTNLAGREGVEATAVGSPVVRDRTLDPLCAPEAPTAKVD
jgi:hypothetical protein